MADSNHEMSGEKHLVQRKRVYTGPTRKTAGRVRARMDQKGDAFIARVHNSKRRRKQEKAGRRAARKRK